MMQQQKQTTEGKGVVGRSVVNASSKNTEVSEEIIVGHVLVIAQAVVELMTGKRLSPFAKEFIPKIKVGVAEEDGDEPVADLAHRSVEVALGEVKDKLDDTELEGAQDTLMDIGLFAMCQAKSVDRSSLKIVAQLIHAKTPPRGDGELLWDLLPTVRLLYERRRIPDIPHDVAEALLQLDSLTLEHLDDYGDPVALLAVMILGPLIDQYLDELDQPPNEEEPPPLSPLKTLQARLGAQQPGRRLRNHPKAIIQDGHNDDDDDEGSEDTDKGRTRKSHDPRRDLFPAKKVTPQDITAAVKGLADDLQTDAEGQNSGEGVNRTSNFAESFRAFASRPGAPAAELLFGAIEAHLFEEASIRSFAALEYMDELGMQQLLELKADARRAESTRRPAFLEMVEESLASGVSFGPAQVFLKSKHPSDQIKDVSAAEEHVEAFRGASGLEGQLFAIVSRIIKTTRHTFAQEFNAEQALTSTQTQVSAQNVPNRSTGTGRPVAPKPKGPAAGAARAPPGLSTVAGGANTKAAGGGKKNLILPACFVFLFFFFFFLCQTWYSGVFYGYEWYSAKHPGGRKRL